MELTLNIILLLVGITILVWGANKFVDVGNQIKSGQTLLIIEAMKTMNPIESSLQGKVLKVLVENEQAVEFGQPLMLIG